MISIITRIDDLTTAARAARHARCHHCHRPLRTRRYRIIVHRLWGPIALHRRHVRPLSSTRLGQILIIAILLMLVVVIGSIPVVIGSIPILLGRIR